MRRSPRPPGGYGSSNGLPGFHSPGSSGESGLDLTPRWSTRDNTSSRSPLRPRAESRFKVEDRENCRCRGGQSRSGFGSGLGPREDRVLNRNLDLGLGLGSQNRCPRSEVRVGLFSSPS